MKTTFDTFISYRRKDSDGKVSRRDIAARIKNAYENRGYDVFFDLDTIQDGFFDDVILSRIRTCKVFILILSPDALLRCSNQNDWVRREIKEAIDSGCHKIPIEYEEIDFVYDELVLAKNDGKCGFLSLNNETIIPFEYDSAHIFRYGLAPVCINHRWGYINKQNEKVIPLKYDMATPFSEYGLAVVNINGETHYIDKGGKLYIYDPELLK